MVTPEISRSAWTEEKCQQENLHITGNIAMNSAPLGSEPERNYFETQASCRHAHYLSKCLFLLR